MLVQQPVAVAHGHVLRLDHPVAQTRTVRDEYFEFFLLLLGVLVQHPVVGRQPRLALGVPCGGSHADPFELALERLAALALLLFLQSQPLRLLLEPAAVVAFPRNAFAPVEFEYPSGHVVEEVTVVRDGDHRSLVLSQVLLEPVDALGVEMVRRLVQQQHVGLLQQEPAQRHAATLAAREVLHRLVGVGTAQCVHRRSSVASSSQPFL